MGAGALAGLGMWGWNVHQDGPCSRAARVEHVSTTPAWPLRLAIVLAGLETVGIVVFIIAIAIAARSSQGSTVTATGPEIAIYGVFALLMAWLTFGLVRRNPLARTPYLIAQLFVGIIGYTVLVGDGVFTKIVGALILAVGVVGTVNSLMPSFVQSLTNEGPPPEGLDDTGRHA